MQSDPFKSFPVRRESPAVSHFPITPSDTDDLPLRPRVFRADVGGTVTARDESGVDITYTLVDGETLIFSPVRILATGTTATGLVGWL